MKKLLLLVTSIMASLSSFAYDFEHNGYYYNIISLGDLTAELTCSGDDTDNCLYYGSNTTATYNGDIEIPTSADYKGNTFSVISINSAAFTNCSIGTLTIPKEIEGVTLSKKNWDTSLWGTFENIILEDGETPFMGGLASGWTGDYDNGGVTCSVYLGRTLNCNGNPVCGSFSTITFGPLLTEVPKYCCYGCNGLVEVNLPNNIVSIGDYAFQDCKSLKKITGPEVTAFGYSFSGCNSLEYVDFPKLRNLGSFYNCQALKGFTIPMGVAYLPSGTFASCTSLEKIHIPSTVTRIGNSGNYDSTTFTGCANLTTISVGNPVPVEIHESNFDTKTYFEATLKVPVGAKEAYSQATVWKNFINIEEDPTIIDDIYTIAVYNNTTSYGSIALEFEDALEQYDKYRFAKKGSAINVVVSPNNNYRLKTLTINDVDVTSEVVDNTYSFTVNGSVNVNASFEYYYNPQPEKDIYLAIKQADNGSVKLKASKWSIYNFMITPADGWTIHSVTFNGQDVTSEVGADGSYTVSYINDDSELVVAFEERISSISSPFASNARVFASYGNIIVKDADQGEAIVIYDESGKMHTNTISDGGTQTFDVPMSGIYIVKVGNKTVKVGL